MDSNYNNIYILISIILVIVILFLVLRLIGSITISTPNAWISESWKHIIYSVVIAILLLIPIFKKSNLIGILSTIIIAIIIYMIFMTSGVPNLQNMIPKVDYPPPTHLGLDGVSLQTMVAGGYK